jgi:uncharacterized membrane protein YesL
MDTMSDKRTPLGASDAFARVTGAVYWYAVVEVAFVLAALPGVVGLVLLVPVPGNVPLYALCALPLIPAFSAALSALRARTRGDDLDPWRQFWRRWRANLRDVLPVGVVAVILLGLFAFNAAFGQAVDGFFAIAALVLGVVTLVWTVHAIVIASLYRFRVRDVARLAALYLVAKPLASLGVVSLAIVSAAAAALSVWLLLAAASVLAGLVLAGERPVIADVEARFIAPEPT